MPMSDEATLRPSPSQHTHVSLITSTLCPMASDAVVISTAAMAVHLFVLVVFALILVLRFMVV